MGIYFLLPLTNYAQPLNILTTKKQYRQSVTADSSNKMVELHSLIPGIVYDLRYATMQNFTGTQLYKSGTQTYLRLPAAKALAQVQQELNTMGYGLKIFDAYRPYSATQKMWQLIQDERYVANPAKGSGHNRGLAVDLTIIDMATHKELAMGTGFDNFTDTAHQSFTYLPENVLQNRKLLMQVMRKYGFQPLSTEWWHFYWPNDKNYAVLNLSFAQLNEYVR